MKSILILCAAFGLTLSSFAALAADPVVQDDFGGSYFTAAAPKALEDNEGDALNVDAFALADEISKIEPAAGGESVFILPDEDAAITPQSTPTPSDRLSEPTKAIIPGMDSIETTTP